MDNPPPPRSGLRGLLDRWRGFANRVARVQTAILLTVVYALIILPMGLLLHLLGRSPLNHPGEGADSHWSAREAPEYTIERFRRPW